MDHEPMDLEGIDNNDILEDLMTESLDKLNTKKVVAKELKSFYEIIPSKALKEFFSEGLTLHHRRI
jgi:hypothetical protein